VAVEADILAEVEAVEADILAEVEAAAGA